MNCSALRRAAFALFVAGVWSASALAASGAAVITVESVLSPVWIERTNGTREPLAITTAIGNKDKIVTGEGGRVMLRMAEGSAIKLGEGALLGVDDLLRKPEAKSAGVVAASLDVVRGAFRFTTGFLSKPSAERDVLIKE